MPILCGIVGLPNVGKSTLFNALTSAGVAADNYPFCTIDPNVGVVPVPDGRLEAIAAIVRPERVVPTAVEFLDIAGLVAGASKGEGLGNQFLAHIRETHAIAHVVRCFESQDVVHVAGRIDPVSDIEVVNTELALADLQTVERNLERAAKQSKSGDKDAIRRSEFLQRVRDHLDTGEPVRSFVVDELERPELQALHLLTTKPTMYVANVAEDELVENPYLDQVKELAAREGAEVVPICGAIEAELASLNDEERDDFLRELGMEEPGLDRVIHAAYRLLGLRTFFTTTGGEEVKAWTIPSGATAPEAAGAVHTDFERGFIRAEVISYEDFVSLEGEHGAREAGRLRLEGRDYVVQEGDVIRFRSNV